MKKIIIIILGFIFSIGVRSTQKDVFVYATGNEDGYTGAYEYMTEEKYNADFEPFIATTPKSSGMSMVTYFQNLYTYSPVNSHGSCGYVSFIQYLSYYDTFRNDNIIPTVYERSQGSVSSLGNCIIRFAWSMQAILSPNRVV